MGTTLGPGGRGDRGLVSASLMSNHCNQASAEWHFAPTPGSSGPTHLPDLPEALGRHAGKDVTLGSRQDLEGNGAVVVLQRRDVIVAYSELCAGVDLVSRVHGESRRLRHPAAGICMLWRAWYLQRLEGRNQSQ